VRAPALLLAVLTPATCVEKQTPPHELWDRGDCSSCHDGEAPKHHTETDWLRGHGRSRGAEPERCAACHPSEECQECHERAPDSHTPGFLRPGAAGPDRQRHAVLARLNPGGCAVCHLQLHADCSPCHGPTEIWSWQSEEPPSWVPLEGAEP